MEVAWGLSMWRGGRFTRRRVADDLSKAPYFVLHGGDADASPLINLLFAGSEISAAEDPPAAARGHGSHCVSEGDE